MAGDLPGFFDSQAEENRRITLALSMHLMVTGDCDQDRCGPKIGRIGNALVLETGISMCGSNWAPRAGQSGR
jgi:hypothetical protein